MGYGNLSTRKVIDQLYIGSSRGIVHYVLVAAHIKKDYQSKNMGGFIKAIASRSYIRVS